MASNSHQADTFDRHDGNSNCGDALMFIGGASCNFWMPMLAALSGIPGEDNMLWTVSDDMRWTVSDNMIWA